MKGKDKMKVKVDVSTVLRVGDLEPGQGFTDRSGLNIRVHPHLAPTAPPEEFCLCIYVPFWHVVWIKRDELVTLVNLKLTNREEPK